MHSVRVVKASTSSVLENNINTVLEEADKQLKLVDIKVSGAYDGKDETFIAVIVFKA